VNGAVSLNYGADRCEYNEFRNYSHYCTDVRLASASDTDNGGINYMSGRHIIKTHVFYQTHCVLVARQIPSAAEIIDTASAGGL